MLSDCGGFGRGLEGIGEEAGGDGVWGMGDGGGRVERLEDEGYHLTKR